MLVGSSCALMWVAKQGWNDGRGGLLLICRCLATWFRAIYGLREAAMFVAGAGTALSLAHHAC